MAEERRKPFVADKEKFSTQRTVTYCLLLQFALVAAQVLYQNDQSERSMILQTIINLTLLAVGYWLGSSKAAAETGAHVQMNEPTKVTLESEPKPAEPPK